MKVSIVNRGSRVMNFMIPLFTYSLQDLGWFCEDINEADVIIGIQKFPDNIQKEKGKHYIFLQIEQLDNRPEKIEQFCKFPADEIWGFNIRDKKEKYFCLGYHPKLDFSDTSKKKIDVSFLGCLTSRRLKFFSSLNHPVNFINNFDLIEKSKICKNSKINLDVKSYDPMDQFTCWDRLAFLISNKCFVLCERTYTPFKNIVYFERNQPLECRKLIHYYLINEQKRIEKENALYEEFKTNFDMRDILERRIKYKNSSNHKITFIIPTIGRPTLHRTLLSLENQNSNDWKAIVVFDGISPTIKETERIKVIVSPKLGGKEKRNMAGQVRNYAFDKVDTEYTAFLDDDDTVDENYVNNALYELEKDNTDCLIYTMKYSDGRIVPGLDVQDIIQNQVGISFCLKTSLLKNNLKFCNSANEDFLFLNDLKNQGYKYKISRKEYYKVRPTIIPFTPPKEPVTNKPKSIII